MRTSKNRISKQVSDQLDYFSKIAWSTHRKFPASSLSNQINMAKRAHRCLCLLTATTAQGWWIEGRHPSLPLPTLLHTQSIFLPALLQSPSNLILWYSHSNCQFQFLCSWYHLQPLLTSYSFILFIFILIFELNDCQLIDNLVKINMNF